MSESECNENVPSALAIESGISLLVVSSGMGQVEVSFLILA